MEYLWIIALVAVAAGILVKLKTRRPATAEPEKPVTLTSPASTAAQRWLKERKEKLYTDLRGLTVLRAALRERKIWQDADEHRFETVTRNVSDYVESLEQQLMPSYHSYRKLHREGPFTSVAINSSGWSLAWGVWMVDAHIEMLKLQAEIRLALLAPDVEHREWKERHLAELEKCIKSAGYDTGNEFMPQYRLTNAVRQCTGMMLVNFDETPFGQTLDQALDLVRVSGNLPEASDYFHRSTEIDAIRSMMEAFSSARTAAWRELTAAEKQAVRAMMPSNS